MGSHTPHLTPLVHPGRTGLEGSPAGKSRGDPLKSALPLTPTHQKDKSKPLREEALKNHLLHLTCFADKGERYGSFHFGQSPTSEVLYSCSLCNSLKAALTEACLHCQACLLFTRTCV